MEAGCQHGGRARQRAEAGLWSTLPVLCCSTLTVLCYSTIFSSCCHVAVLRNLIDELLGVVKRVVEAPRDDRVVERLVALLAHLAPFRRSPRCRTAA